MKKIFYLSFLILYSLLFCSCGDLFNDEITDGSSAASLTSAGWTEYESGNYDNAILKFNDAIKADANYADAYNGLGWAYGKKGDLTNSISNFTTAISKNNTLADAYAGRGFAYTANNNHSNAITDGLWIVSNNPSYSFSHDSKINIKDIRIMLAQNYYYQKDYNNACNQVKALDSNFSNCSDTSALLDKIVQLERDYGSGS